MKKIIVTGFACALLTGCQTVDKTLDSADRAIAVTKTPTAKTISDVAKSDNREAVIREGLKRRAELYEPDPRAVDLFSDKSVTLSSAKEPYLLGLVQDQRGKSIATPAQAESYADYLLQKQSETRKVDAKEGAKDALFVNFSMVANFQNKQAEKYRAVVGKYAAQYKVSPSLVFAVIRTESNFNPFAVSSAPAYGMMQLVPSSGGREGYRAAKGRDEMPSREYLFDAQNNIELGTAYLGVLSSKQLDYVSNATSREYCVISAYNTGPSNVLKAFSRDKVAAVNSINSLEPPGVYDKLRTGLPYEETRQYLVRVVGYRKQFLTFGK